MRMRLSIRCTSDSASARTLAMSRFNLAIKRFLPANIFSAGSINARL